MVKKKGIFSQLFESSKKSKQPKKTTHTKPVQPTKKKELIVPKTNKPTKTNNYKEAIQYIRTGRPTLYKDEYCEIVFRELATGGTLTDAANAIGVLTKDIYNWSKKSKKFLLAIKIGKQYGEALWARFGLENLYSKAFNHVLWMMNMSNRYGWSSSHTVKGKIEKTEKKDIKVTFDNTDAELAEVLSILNNAGALVKKERQAGTGKIS